MGDTLDQYRGTLIYSAYLLWSYFIDTGRLFKYCRDWNDGLVLGISIGS